MILFFSGCGNSQYVAEQLADLTGDRLLRINPLDESPSLNLEQGEPFGVVCPVYAWAVPRLVDDYVARLVIPQPPTYTYLACTCGDNVGRTPELFDKSLKRKGLHLDAAFSFIMPETYVNVAGFNLDSPENVQRKISDVNKRLPLVAARIRNHEKVIDVTRGGSPRLKSSLANALFYSLLITDRKFHVNDKCVSCGLCEKNCPLSNISFVDGRPRWNGNCTNCMSCYHRCPTNAIHFGSATLTKGQYYFH